MVTFAFLWSLWVLLRRYAFLWVLMRPYESLRVLRCPYKSLCNLIGSFVVL